MSLIGSMIYSAGRSMYRQAVAVKDGVQFVALKSKEYAERGWAEPPIRGLTMGLTATTGTSYVIGQLNSASPGQLVLMMGATAAFTTALCAPMVANAVAHRYGITGEVRFK